MRVRAKRALALILTFCIIFAFPAVSFASVVYDYKSMNIPNPFYDYEFTKSTLDEFLNIVKEKIPEAFQNLSPIFKYNFFVAIYQIDATGGGVTVPSYCIELHRVINPTTDFYPDRYSDHYTFYSDLVDVRDSSGNYSLRLRQPMFLKGRIDPENNTEEFKIFAVKNSFLLSDAFPSTFSNEYYTGVNPVDQEQVYFDSSFVVQNDFYFHCDYLTQTIGLSFDNVKYIVNSFISDKHIWYDIIQHPRNRTLYYNRISFVQGSNIYNNYFSGGINNFMKFHCSSNLQLRPPSPINYNFPLNVDGENILDGHNPNGDSDQAVENVENALGGKDGGTTNLNGGLKIMDDLIKGNATAANGLGGIFSLINQIIAPLVGMIVLFSVCMFLIHKAGE